MNMRNPGQLKGQTMLLDEALGALARMTGLKAKLLARTPKAARGAQPDAEIEIAHAGKRHRYLVEVKNVDRKVGLTQAKERLRAYGNRGVLVTPYLTNELAGYCRELGIQFIDAGGNAYLRDAGLYICVLGQKAPATATPRAGGTAAAVRIVFALLCKPELLDATYRDIARHARVALGTVGWTFQDLEGRGLVMRGKKRNRKFVDRMRLLDEWVVNYPIKLRPKLVRKFHAAAPNWWQHAELERYRAVWGGEVAGDRLTGNREPGTCTVYLRGDPTQFIIDHRLRADPGGEVELLEKFWEFETEEDKRGIAPPLLVYADLLATLDPRNHDTARLIRAEFLADAQG